MLTELEHWTWVVWVARMTPKERAVPRPMLGLQFGLNRGNLDPRCVVPGSTRLDVPAVSLLRRCCRSRRVVGKRYLDARTCATKDA